MDSSLFDPVWIKAILKALILPPTGLLLVSLLGLSLYRRAPRAGPLMAWGGVLLLLVLAVPTVSSTLLRTLEVGPPFDIARASDARAIVIIGGGKRRFAAEYGGRDALGELTLERVRYGARVARMTHLPILVSGGAVYGGETEAQLMRAALENEFGQPVRWLEDRSRTTHENALRSAEILRAADIHKVILVANNFDIRRAVAEFADARIETVPAPTGGSFERPDSLFDFLPSMSGLRGSYYALYELCANALRLVWR